MNASEHRLASGLVMALTAVTVKSDSAMRPALISKRVDDTKLTVVLAAGSFGAVCGTLPDIIEPALNPHHRQFFHSVTFAALLCAGIHGLWKWEPEKD